MSKTRKEFLRDVGLSFLGLGFIRGKTDRTTFKIPAAGEDSYDLTRKAENKILRSISYNVFNGCIGFVGNNNRNLTSNQKSTLLKRARDLGQIPIRMAMELQLYDPDIINFSEGPKEDVAKEIADYLGYKYAFFAGGQKGDGNFPGCIFSKFEIKNAVNRPFIDAPDEEELFTRHWGKADLLLKDGSAVTVHSAHLWPFRKSTEDTEIRLREIEALLNSIRNDLENRGSRSVLLQGDLNLTPNTEEYQALKEGNLIKDTFSLGMTNTHDGFGLTYPSIKPMRRLDYIFAGGELSDRIIVNYPLFRGNFRMNNDDFFGFALSDHIPTLTDFSLNE